MNCENIVSGKIYGMFIISIALTVILICIVYGYSNKKNEVIVEDIINNQIMYGFSIVFMIIQLLITLYLICYDIFSNLKDVKINYILIPTIVFSSIYMLVFGTTSLMKIEPDPDHEFNFDNSIIISSIIISSIGLLYIFSELLCNFMCKYL